YEILVLRSAEAKTYSDVLLKYDGLVPIKQNAVFDVPADGMRQNDLFYVPAFLDEVVDCVTVMDADYVLLDDWAIVENLGYVVRCCADELYTPLKRLMIGL